MIKLLSLLFFILLVSSREIERKKRHVTLFNIIKFDNDPCNSQQTTSRGQVRKGTCYTESECTEKRGTISGNCASGFGVCCLFLINSGTASQNCTYLRNDGFPTSVAIGATASTSNFVIRKCDANVCRVRLDFEAFQIGGPVGTAPDVDGPCTDAMQVTTSTNNFIPTVCGTNTGQHMYVEFPSASTGEINLNFLFSAASTQARTFEIKATQYHCHDKNQPPVGCLQWHTGGTGRIKTFNFDGDTVHLNQQDYNICVRQEKDMCCVEYSVCSDIDVDESFSLIGQHDMPGEAGVGDEDCLTDPATRNDHITINGGAQQCGCRNVFPPVQRFCGERFSAVSGGTEHIPICDCCPPFDIHVFTDGDDTTDMPTGSNDEDTSVSSRGVCLDYRQIPC